MSTSSISKEKPAEAEVTSSPTLTEFASGDVRIKQKAIAEARTKSLSDFVIEAKPRQGQMKKMKKAAGV